MNIRSGGFLDDGPPEMPSTSEGTALLFVLAVAMISTLVMLALMFFGR